MRRIISFEKKAGQNACAFGLANWCAHSWQQDACYAYRAVACDRGANAHGNMHSSPSSVPALYSPARCGYSDSMCGSEDGRLFAMPERWVYEPRVVCSDALATSLFVV